MRLSRSSPDHRMQKKFTNKYFIDVICNKVQSSFELLTEANHHTREEKDEKEKIFLVWPVVTRLLDTAAGVEGKQT